MGRTKNPNVRYGASILSRDHPMRALTASNTVKEFIPDRDPAEKLNPASKRSTFAQILKSHVRGRRSNSPKAQQFGNTDTRAVARFSDSPMIFGEDIRTYDPHIQTPGVGTYAVRHGERYTQFHRSSSSPKLESPLERFDYQSGDSGVSNGREVQITNHKGGVPPTGTYKPAKAKRLMMRRPQTTLCDLSGRREAKARGERIHTLVQGAPNPHTPAPTTYFDENGQLPSAHLESHPSAMILTSDMPEWGNGYSAEVAKYESTAHHEWETKGMLDDQTPGGPEGSVLAEAHRRSPKAWTKRAASALSPCSVFSPWVGRGSRTAFGFGSGNQRFEKVSRSPLHDTSTINYDGHSNGGFNDKLNNIMCTLGIATLSDQTGRRQTFRV